ncbi:MAG: T9SS type A sorting domain-containing protein [Bacteroidota bacterium]
MKTYILSLLIWMAGVTLSAQPQLEKIYSESATICELESMGEVYYSMDVINKKCHIYRMDHSLYKSISIPTPEGYYLSDVQYVSEKLFNNDDHVELVYSYTKYVPTTNSYYYTYETRLINENGSVLLTVPGAGYTEVIETDEHGKKFLVYEYNYSVIPYRTYTHVYNLPESNTKTAFSMETAFGLGEAFPNPAGDQVNIPVQLPAGIESGTLEIVELSGRRVMSQPIHRSSSAQTIPTKQLAPGTYLYYVESGHLRSSSKKMVIK